MKGAQIVGRDTEKVTFNIPSAAVSDFTSVWPRLVAESAQKSETTSEVQLKRFFIPAEGIDQSILEEQLRTIDRARFLEKSTNQAGVHGYLLEAPAPEKTDDWTSFILRVKKLTLEKPKDEELRDEPKNKKPRKR